MNKNFCPSRRSGWSVGMLLLAVVGGCADVEPPRFQLNMTSMVSNELAPEYQQEIADVLGGLFGTPDEPYAHPSTGLDQLRLEQSAGPAWTDAQGVNQGLYRKHCVHCHGVSGDGRGPTAAFLNPYPRDYRKGVFKFKSTANPAKPTDDDLHRVLVNGVPGTSMPSFSLLPSAELESLIEYVKYLAIRGQVETELARFVYDELGEEEVEGEDGEPKMVRIPLDPAKDSYQREAILDIVASVVEEWEAAGDNVIHPDESGIPDDQRSPEEVAASIAKGRELFYSKLANCYTCHGPTGLGDGQQDDYNVWNKETKQFVDETQQLAEAIARREAEGAEDGESPEAREKRLDRLQRDRELLDRRLKVVETLLPVRNAIPRNLRSGVYRGGRRRIDVFWKIHAGIAGTPMPGLGGSKVTEEQLWNIVDYVLNLPYEAPSQPQRALPLNEHPIAAGG